jgi:hypothetical protein
MRPEVISAMRRKPRQAAHSSGVMVGGVMRPRCPGRVDVSTRTFYG